MRDKYTAPFIVLASIFVLVLAWFLSAQTPTQHTILGTDENGDLNIPFNLRFSGTTAGGIFVKGLTTTERDALTLGVSDFCTIWNTTQGRANVWSGSEWTSDEPAGSSTWQFSNSTVATDPGAGNIRYNNATPSLVTSVFISDFNINGVNLSAILSSVQLGDDFIALQADNAGNSVLGTVGTPVDNTTWWEFPLTSVTGSGTVPQNNRAVDVGFQNPTATSASLAEIAAAIAIDTDAINNAIHDLFPYGGISAKGNTTAEPTDTTPEQILAWNTNELFNGVVVDHTDDAIKVSDAGVYEVHVSVSCTNDGSSNNVFIEIYVFDDSIATWVATGFKGHSEVPATNGDMFAISVNGLVTLDVNDKVGAFHYVSTGSEASFTINEAQLMIRKVND